MVKKVLAPFPLWASLVHALALALSLAVIAEPSARILPVRWVLTALLFLFLYQSVVRLKRANGLKTSMSELSQHLPTGHHFTESLGLIAYTVTAFTTVLAF